MKNFRGWKYFVVELTNNFCQYFILSGPEDLHECRLPNFPVQLLCCLTAVMVKRFCLICSLWIFSFSFIYFPKHWISQNFLESLHHMFLHKMLACRLHCQDTREIRVTTGETSCLWIRGTICLQPEGVIPVWEIRYELALSYKNW